MKKAKSKLLPLILKIYSMIGILVASVALLLMIIRIIDREIIFEYNIELMIAMFGIVFALFSYTIAKMEKIKQEKKATNLIEEVEILLFLSKWNDFEEKSLELIKREDEGINKYSINEVINLISKKGIVTNTEKEIIERILKFRNVLVHDEINISPELINKYSSLLEKITEKF